MQEKKTLNTDKIPVDWNSIIYREIESEELDYKAAQNWSQLKRSGKAKFVRHCIAMANTKGGYLVVGVGEDSSGRPRLYTGLTDRQLKSFDPTAVGNFINRYADPQVDFTIEKPVVDGKKYVVFVIHRFSTLPHVCSYGCEFELQQGVFYIRTADASSRPAYRASEIHTIVQRALRNQREILGRMLRGVLYESGQSLEPEAQNHFAEQVRHSRLLFQKRKPGFVPSENIRLELSVFPAAYEAEKFSLSEIKQAVDNSLSIFTESSFLLKKEINGGFFSNVAFRVFPEDTGKFCQFFQSGLFHYLTLIPKNRRALNYRRLAILIAEAVYFLGQYYLELGYDDELLSIKFKLDGVEKTVLSRIPGNGQKDSGKKKNASYVCRIPEINVKMQRTVADFVSGPVGHSVRIIREICERFNLPAGKHDQIEDSIRKYLENRNE
jgi:hypothetical protein